MYTYSLAYLQFIDDIIFKQTDTNTKEQLTNC